MPDITSYSHVTPEMFLDQIKPAAQPAVLKGLVAHWPAVAWGAGNADALLDHLAAIATPVPVSHFSCDPQHRGRFFYADGYTSFNYRQEQAPADEFFARLRREADNRLPTALFAGSLALAGHFPSFADDHHIRAFIPASQYLQSIWIGNRTMTAPHYDAMENIACVVAGRRRFTLFPIDQYANLYVGPIDLTPAGQPISLVDIRAPDHDRFPRYHLAEAQALTATLDPGDAIYIPTLWWHGVESLDPVSAMVNTWWRDVPGHFGAPMDALLQAVLALRDLPPVQRDAWKVVFDHLIFATDGPALAHLPPAARGIFGDLTRSNAAHIREILSRSL